jgi:hypothetical protein
MALCITARILDLSVLVFSLNAHAPVSNSDSYTEHCDLTCQNAIHILLLESNNNEMSSGFVLMQGFCELHELFGSVKPGNFLNS